MRIKTTDHQKGTTTTRDYPYTVKTYLAIHWGAWGGFFSIFKSGKAWEIYDAITQDHLYTVARG